MTLKDNFYQVKQESIYLNAIYDLISNKMTEMNTIYIHLYAQTIWTEKSSLVLNHIRVKEHFISVWDGCLHWKYVKIDKLFTLNIDYQHQSEYNKNKFHLKRM